MKNLLSFEKMNLFATAPEKTMKFSPKIEVLNILEEYLVVLLEINLWSIAPSRFAAKNWRVSPIIGQPKLPGGSVGPVPVTFSLVL